MTEKEMVLRAIKFRNPERFPLWFFIDRSNAFNATGAEELSVVSMGDMMIVHNGDSDYLSSNTEAKTIEACCRLVAEAHAAPSGLHVQDLLPARGCRDTSGSFEGRVADLLFI